MDRVLVIRVGGLVSSRSIVDIILGMAINGTLWSRNHPPVEYV